VSVVLKLPMNVTIVDNLYAVPLFAITVRKAEQEILLKD
jgi:hypothetical protein